MTNWVSNRWADAFLKFIVSWAILHVIFAVIGIFAGTLRGAFGMAMIWPHWTYANAANVWLAVISSIVGYFLIFFAWSSDESYDTQST